MWRALLRDSVARIVLVAAVVLWAPYVAGFWLPELARITTELSVLYALQALSLLLAIGVCLWRLVERPRIERQFWALITTGLMCWLGVHVVEFAIDGNWSADLRLSVIGDTGYVLLYLATILALELRPHAEPERGKAALQRKLALAGTGAFVLGLYAYFIGVSVLFDRASYWSWIPSTSLFVVCDAYLVLRSASLMLAVTEVRWRTSYALLFTAVLGWLVLDGSELLERLQLVVNPLPDQMVETLWFLTPCLIALAARACKLARGPTVPAPADEDPFRALWGGPVLACAIAFALVHLLVQLSPGEAAEDSGPHQVVALTTLLGLLGMALSSQRLLAGENARLTTERSEANARARLAERLEALGRLAGGVAHDFNNQLQVIRLCSESLVQELDPRSSQRLHAEEIALAAERASTLTARLLSLSRDNPARPTAFDLNAAVARTVGMLRRVIGEDVQLEVSLDPRAGTILADRAQLEHVLLNLGVNARDALPEGGTIRVATASLEAEGRPWAVLEMRDTGIGMDPALCERIFEPFFTTKRETGTGLGLVLVKSFVDSLEGRIEVDSRPGAGTTFRLILPAAGEVASEVSTALVAPRVSGSGTVLVVEDERPVRSVLCGFLQQNGFRVLEAADGVEALEILARPGVLPVLVIADLTMPRMGGAELEKRIRERWPELPVLFMTGYARGVLTPRHPTWPSLQKPFSRSEFDRCLAEALAARPGTHRAGPVEAPELAASGSPVSATRGHRPEGR